jgi:MFS family permease
MKYLNITSDDLMMSRIGYGDITPSSSVEVGTAILIMIVGIGLFASILGKIADIVANSRGRSYQEQQVRKKLTGVATFTAAQFSCGWICSELLHWHGL